MKYLLSVLPFSYNITIVFYACVSRNATTYWVTKSDILPGKKKEGLRIPGDVKGSYFFIAPNPTSRMKGFRYGVGSLECAFKDGIQSGYHVSKALPYQAKGWFFGRSCLLKSLIGFSVRGTWSTLDSFLTLGLSLFLPSVYQESLRGRWVGQWMVGVGDGRDEKGELKMRERWVSRKRKWCKNRLKRR